MKIYIKRVSFYTILNTVHLFDLCGGILNIKKKKNVQERTLHFVYDEWYLSRIRFIATELFKVKNAMNLLYSTSILKNHHKYTYLYIYTYIYTFAINLLYLP